MLSGVDLVLRKAEVSQQRLSEPAAGREWLQKVSLPSLFVPTLLLTASISAFSGLASTETS